MRFCFESDRAWGDPASKIARMPWCARRARRAGQGLSRNEDPAARREVSPLEAEARDHQRFGVKYGPEVGAAQISARDLDGTPFVALFEFPEEAD